jgi:hypothetical protein
MAWYFVKGSFGFLAAVSGIPLIQIAANNTSKSILDVPDLPRHTPRRNLFSNSVYTKTITQGLQLWQARNSTSGQLRTWNLATYMTEENMPLQMWSPKSFCPLGDSELVSD